MNAFINGQISSRCFPVLRRKLPRRRLHGSDSSFPAVFCCIISWTSALELPEFLLVVQSFRMFVAVRAVKIQDFAMRSMFCSFPKQWINFVFGRVRWFYPCFETLHFELHRGLWKLRWRTGRPTVRLPVEKLMTSTMMVSLRLSHFWFVKEFVSLFGLVAVRFLMSIG
ncbi:hypothetical protein HPP92_014141 [Vanilla planifolia]|uniref:Uncharacterized protein n=1 Tax=Vanilla planifolia TaxID=51239 RepID=A0A835QW42_VANPL|nr:hypothetical protein HPP92_014141 [Vanilla planifolia]